MSKFSGSDIVEFGVQIEKNGRDFYNALLKCTGNIKLKETFKFLAQAEEEHVKDFEKILDLVEKHEPSQVFTQEYFGYMKASAKQYVFTEKDTGREIAENVKSESDGLDLGIDFEKKSIKFYQEMKKCIPEEGQGLLDELISQEEGHLKNLERLKSEFG